MILTADQIEQRSLQGALIDPFSKSSLQGASYDLTAGSIIWKENNGSAQEAIIKIISYETTLPPYKQPMVTLQPGQVMFVITREFINIPLDLCGTVYAKNKFSRDGILALTTGHIDPGVKCPIVIRLINLRSIPFTFKLGEEIYTIVFDSISPSAESKYERTITLQETISKTIESANAALGNALHDISLTQQFIKKEEIGKYLWEWLKGNMLKAIGIAAAIIGWIIATVAGIMQLMEYLKNK